MNLNEQKKFRETIYSNLDLLFEKLHKLAEKEEKRSNLSTKSKTQVITKK